MDLVGNGSKWQGGAGGCVTILLTGDRVGNQQRMGVREQYSAPWRGGKERFWAPTAEVSASH